jgi:hypothetical protein
VRRRRAAGDEDEELPKLSLEEALQAERERLFRAMAVVDACRLGSDSFLTHPKGREEPDYDYALLVVYDLIDECAGRLEIIGTACRAKPQSKQDRWRK